jgi:hypothetical protein
VPHRLRRENQPLNRKLLPTEVQAMKSVNEIELKNFPDEGLTNESIRSVSDAPLFLDLMRKQDVEPPMPYCLCHKIDLKTSMLEIKHCMVNDCPHLVFVKEVWTASHQNEEVALSRRANEAKMA